MLCSDILFIKPNLLHEHIQLKGNNKVQYIKSLFEFGLKGPVITIIFVTGIKTPKVRKLQNKIDEMLVTC